MAFDALPPMPAPSCRNVRIGRAGRQARQGRRRHRHLRDRRADDLWDAVTTPGADQALVRADQRRAASSGGRYQLEGNAGGTITACEGAEVFAATWEMGGQVQLGRGARSLRPSPARTKLELTHIAIVDRDASHWDSPTAPGAVGVGWDLGLHGLQRCASSRRTGRCRRARGRGGLVRHASTRATSGRLGRGARCRCRTRDCTPAAWSMRRRRPSEPRAVLLGERLGQRRESVSDPMHAFDVLGDPVRRRILELLATARACLGRGGGGDCRASSASPRRR